jgi:hypothetical protein
MAASKEKYAFIVTDDQEADVVVFDTRVAKGLFGNLPKHRTGRFVIVGDDSDEVRVFGGLWQSVQREQLTIDDLIDALSPDRVLGPAATEQARLNAAARAEFLQQHETFSSAEVADLVGSSAKNRNEAARKLTRRGHVFAVRYKGRDFFPAFQFDLAASQPRPVVAKVLAELDKAGLRGWELAFWFTDQNDWLPKEQTPVALLDTTPDLVVEAAAHEHEIPW